MKSKSRKVIFLMFLSILLACKDFVTVGPPSNQIVTSTVFLTEQTATAAVTGLYITLSGGSLQLGSGAPTVYLGLYADELNYTLTGATTIEFLNGEVLPENSLVYSNFWRNAYEVINQANSCIAGLQNSSLNPTLVNQLLGEARFIRAYCYWHLTILFGDVPLVITSTDYEGVSKMSRTPFAEVKEQIFEDLNFAKEKLLPSYPSTGRYRINRYIVSAFLSRVNTYLGNWNDVLTQSNEVISQNGTYILETDLNRVFLIGSTEAIWQTSTGNATTNTYEGTTFVPASGASIRPSYPLQTTLFDAFTTIDKRKTNWIASKTAASVVYRYPNKYKVRGPSTAPKTECQMMIRLAEIYLNRAEAKAHLNDPTAIEDLNKIRNRAGLTNLSGLSGQPLLEAIWNERRLELFVEMGMRWFDIKRTGKLDQVLGPIKSGWISTGALLPIPFNELMAAPNLTQNPGYN